MKARHSRNLAVAAATAVVLCAIGSAVAVRAQGGALVLTPLGGDLTPYYLGQLLLGAGQGDNPPTLLNATYSGDASAAGTFGGGTGIFQVGDTQPLDHGIVLSSGRVTDAVGPNTVPDMSGDFCIPPIGQTGCVPNGDPDLSQLVGAETFDAAVLNLDFIPPQGSNVVKFRYVFTSEEYNEYANSQYNNVFGFYVNGVNYALLPDGITVVSINNVNGGETGSANDPLAHNPQFFRNNVGAQPPINIQADGLTVILTFRAPLIPGQVNHMKLAIADTGDHIFDSWTFLEQATFFESPEICDNHEDDDADGFIDEGCTTESLGQLIEVPPSPEEAVEHTFEFPNLGDIDDTQKTPVLKLTEKTTLRPHRLKVKATVLDPRDLLLPLKNPLVFPFGTTCFPAKTKTPGSLKPCIFYEVVDEDTDLPPIQGVDYEKAPGAIKWVVDYEVESPIVGKVGMGHFKSDEVQTPVDFVDENIIKEYHSGIGESDNYSGVVLTLSPDGPPQLTLSSDLVAEAESAAGAHVDFDASAVGTVTIPGQTQPILQSLAVACKDQATDAALASGSLFALGNTTVECSATDSYGQTTTGTFVVSVVDTTPPVLVPPGVPAQEATGPAGAPVVYTAMAHDLVDGDILVTSSCAPASGSVFAPGATTVSCSPMDSHGNVGSGSFVVNVVDTTKPVLTLPSDIRVPATSANGAIVNYAASGGDLVDGSIAPQCTPASGSQFPIGTTQVQCTATDAHGNTATGSFSVTVGCCDVKISVSPGTVNRGQTALVTISLTNFSRKIVFGVVRFEYTSPCGHALVLQLPAILLPGKKVSFTIPFKVPRFACTGTYTLSTSGTFVDGSSTEHSATLIVR